MFSESQEADLGAILNEEEAGSYQLVRGPQNDYLQTIAKNLVTQLPPNHLPFKFQLLESGEWNAFTLPGNRIYVSRKIVTSAKSEDEVAMILAHEIGHAYFRHPSSSLTEMLQQVLGTQSIGDPQDIAAKLHALSEQRNTKHFKLKHQPDGDDEQNDADALGAYLAARAGYDVSAGAQFWDRVNQLQGKTGSGWSDFFRTTKPDEKRLRRIHAIADQMPPACRTATRHDTSGFADWQKMVLADVKKSEAQLSPAVLKTVQLEDPIRPEVTYVRFSPDGKYLMARDGFGAHVMQVQPFQWLFRIEAPGASTAFQWSNDSHSVLVNDGSLRLESWDVATGTRTEVRELNVPEGCVISKLSPDGSLLLCLIGDLSVKLIDVKSGDTRFQDKRRVAESWEYDQFVQFGYSGVTAFEFSGDSKYLVYRLFRNVVAVNTALGQKFPVSSGLAKYLQYSFGFQGADRVYGINADNPSQSAVLTFPEGRMVAQMSLDYLNIEPVTHGDYANLSPFGKYPLALYSVKDDKVLIQSHQATLDTFNNVMANESRAGEISLSRFGDGRITVLGSVPLPSPVLRFASAYTVSPDDRYVAFSASSRGAIWDLTTGKRAILLRAFDAADFDGKRFVGTFPLDAWEKEKGKDLEGVKRRFSTVPLDTMKPVDLPSQPETGANQSQQYSMFWRPQGKGKDQFGRLLEVRGLDDQQLRWSHFYRKGVPLYYSDQGRDTLTFLFELNSPSGKEELAADPTLAAKARSLNDKRGDYLVELLQLSTGKSLGKVLIETGKGSFSVSDFNAVANKLAVTDFENRTLIYDATTGAIMGRVFGDRPHLSPDLKTLVVRGELDDMLVYDLATFTKRFDVRFESDLVDCRFSQDGKKIFALTADQKVHVVTTEMPSTTAAN